jgi:hypothetical protein
MASRETPASLGVQGPGEIRRPSGGRSTMALAVTASLRTTRVRAPSSPRYWTRLKVKES